MILISFLVIDDHVNIHHTLDQDNSYFKKGFLI